MPLAIVYSLHGFLTSAEQNPPGAIILGTALVIIGALIVSAFGGLVFGVPVYLLAARTGAPRGAVLIVAAAVSGVIVRQLWYGGELFEDLGSTLLFALFGAYSGVAFWYGADKWSRAQ